jgi:N-acylglucosamine 2-epimerase
MDKKLMLDLAELYKTTLLDDIIPFWMTHGVDNEYGGFYNYLGRDGTVLHTDKVVRHLGRFTYLYALFYNAIEKKQEWLDLAFHGADFIDKYGFDIDGRAFYEVTRDGRPVRKRRYVITENYTAMAYSHLALATGDDIWREKARKIYNTVLMYYHNSDLLPPKYIVSTRPTKSHNIPMIIVCTTQEMRLMGDDPLYQHTIDFCLDQVYTNFLKPEKNALLETVNADGSFLETPEGRTINPGHSIESAWFTLEEARYRGNDPDLIQKGCQVLDWSLEWGWDKEHGGILYFVNVDGHPPDQYEHELKLWWPQNETTYACLLAYDLTRDPKYWDWFMRLHEYSFSHFPDSEYGGWFKYLRRDGTLSSDAKGTRWAGMFHLARMLLNCWHLLEKLASEDNDK